MADEVIETRLRADGTQFRRAFKQAETAMDEFARKSGQAVGITTAQFAKMSKASRQQVTELQRTSRAMQAQERAAKNLRGAQGNLGLGALEASRAIEDFSVAGMRGALNNIPQVVTLLGGPAGLAAALSVTAVAGTLLAPKLLGVNDAIAKMRSELTGTLNAQFAAEDRAEALADGMADLDDGSRRYLKTVRGVISEAQREGRVFELNTRRAEENAKAAEELRKARVAAGVETGPGQSKAQALKAELELERERLAVYERQAQALNKRAKLERGRKITDDDVQDAKDELRARKRLLNQIITGDSFGGREVAGKKAKDFGTAEEFAAHIEKNLGRALGSQKGSLQKEQVRQVVEGLEKIREAEDNLKLTQKQLELSAKGSAQALSMLAREADAADDKVAKAFFRIKTLEKNLSVQGEIDALPKPSAVPEGAGSLFDSMTRGTVDRMKARVKARQEKEALNARRGDFAGEMRALQLEAKGRVDMADQLRKQMQMRREGLEISRQLGVSEEKGIRMAREKAALEEKIRREKEGQAALEADGDEEGGGRKIRLLNQRESLRRHINRGGKMNMADRRMIGATGLMGRKIGKGRRIGLRQGAEQQEADRAEAAAQRGAQQMAAAAKEDEVPKWAASLIELQEKQLGIWKEQFN